jgi:oligopeptide/dipeptide ABC transporter ATP-binding protein
MPSPDTKPKGCVFCDRCPNVSDKCLDERPKLKEIDKNHFVACELYL